MRNDVLIIDIDSDRDIPVHVLHGSRSGDDVKPVDTESNIVKDMALICEALVLLIHTAENEGIKKSPQSLRDCITHLENGFADASYFGFIEK